MRASSAIGYPNEHSGVPYTQSQTSRRSDREISVANSQDPYSSDPYSQQPTYSSASGQSGFTPNAVYPPGSNYPSSQVSGYSSVQAYPQVPGYPVGSAYLQGSGYPPGSNYSATSGYSASGYPAAVGRAPESNYTYETDYPNQNYQYRQPGAYASGARPGDPRADPRAAASYPYVSSPQDVPLRGVAADRYDPYGQPIGLGPAQSGRAGFPAPTRGTPTGYDPPQPMDGGYRGEPVREERRRR